MTSGDEQGAERDEAPLRRLKALRLAAWLLGAAGLVLAAAATWRASTHGGSPGLALPILAVATLACALSIGTFLSLTVAAVPGSIAVFSGRSYVGADGKPRAFRVATGGVAIRMPIIESCEILSTGPFLLEHEVRNVYVREGQHAAVWFRFRVAVARDEPLVVHAIERFLGRDDAEIKRLARETLESVVRGEASEHTMDAFRHAGGRLMKTLRRELQLDFDKLGLLLQALEVLEVSEA